MWDLHLPERLPKIALDPAALHRALLNIFTNAAEALDTLPPEATKRVRITGCPRPGTWQPQAHYFR